MATVEVLGWCDRNVESRGASSTEAGALATWFAEKADSGSLVEYLKTFDVTISVMQTREGLVRVARDFVEDLVADGVVYGEIRWAPEQHLTKGLSLDETVHAVQAGIDAGGVPWHVIEEVVLAAVRLDAHDQGIREGRRHLPAHRR